MKYILYLQKSAFQYEMNFTWKKMRFQTPPSMCGSPGDGELEKQVMIQLGLSSVFCGPQVEAWVEVHNRLLLKFGQGGPGVKVVPLRIASKKYA